MRGTRVLDPGYEGIRLVRRCATRQGNGGKKGVKGNGIGGLLNKRNMLLTKIEVFLRDEDAVGYNAIKNCLHHRVHIRLDSKRRDDMKEGMT